MKKATHHTLSLLLPPSPPDAPAALGAGGMPVLCAVAEELDVGVAVEDVRAEEPATFALDAFGVDADRDAEGL